ncbi:hypothetical protein L2728_21940 [Shewanella chilikensis]|uniref:hypothetical protein n=1 Tax=Shewanella chilikensis TaxID=558541 RepID=UPI002010A201|nr:hypothetical protein [Shewanella chilikensis]MCL1164462.1 hypothetical protein [Shewanella chilikensis]
MKQSDLSFIENNKDCVFCTFNDSLEFYWEPRYDRICVRNLHGLDVNPIYISPDLKAPAVRKEICNYIKGAFNV